MKEEELVLFKQRLRAYCIRNITERLATAEALVLRAQESANNDGKSSAGDKYETGRSMGQLEKNMYLQQVADLRAGLADATAIITELPKKMIMRGSLVVCDQLFIFICAGIGKKIVEEKTVLFISDRSPLFKKIYGMVPREFIPLDKAQLQIQHII